jgi:hypothetical protein
MQGNPRRRLSPLEEDNLAQEGVLHFVLSEHPTQLSLAELLSEVDDDDSHRRAVQDLVRRGLLRRVGDSVLPTRAALIFNGIKG